MKFFYSLTITVGDAISSKTIFTDTCKTSSIVDTAGILDARAHLKITFIDIWINNSVTVLHLKNLQCILVRIRVL